MPELADSGLRSMVLGDVLAGADLAVIVTAHPEIDHAVAVAQVPPLTCAA